MTLARLGEAFARAGYDEAGLERALTEEGRLTHAQGVAALRFRDDAEQPALLLARLFQAGDAVDARAAAAVLEPLTPDDLTEVVAVEDGLMRARVKIEPFEGVLVASDASYDGAETVLGVGGATRLVNALTVRRRCGSALDLCTGSGALALLAARHADRVLGVDLSERALRLARLNAALNGLEAIEWGLGDLFEPVGEQQFDLLTANPPFAVSPSQEFLFRDGGHEDDALSASVVAGAAARLQEGGFATVVCNWIAPADGPWAERPRRWVRDSGCDALLLRHQSETPVSYALRWNVVPGRTAADVAEAAKPWLAYLRERGIESLVTGVVVLRRRNGPNWVHEEELTRTPSSPAGAHVERIFAGRDVLEAVDDERGLLDLVLQPSPGTMLVERRHPSGERERVRLTTEEGLPLRTPIPTACVDVLAALDGRRPLRQALGSDALAAECLPTLTDLLGRGLLVAAGSAGEKPL